MVEPNETTRHKNDKDLSGSPIFQTLASHRWLAYAEWDGKDRDHIRFKNLKAGYLWLATSSPCPCPFSVDSNFVSSL